jgi:hypothetical protein
VELSNAVFKLFKKGLHGARAPFGVSDHETLIIVKIKMDPK